MKYAFRGPQRQRTLLMFSQSFRADMAVGQYRPNARVRHVDLAMPCQPSVDISLLHSSRLLSTRVVHEINYLHLFAE